MRFRNLLGWILGIGFIVLLIILVPDWIGGLKENIKENKKNAKIAREVRIENRRFRKENMSEKEKELHKEGRKWLIGFFTFYILMLSLPVIVSLFGGKDCSDYDEDFKTYILKTYAHFGFEAIDYGIQSSQDTCIGYTHGLTTNAFTGSEHLYVIRDVIGGNDIYACWEFREDCSNSDYLSILNKYSIK